MKDYNKKDISVSKKSLLRKFKYQFEICSLKEQKLCIKIQYNSDTQNLLLTIKDQLQVINDLLKVSGFEQVDKFEEMTLNFTMSKTEEKKQRSVWDKTYQRDLENEGKFDYEP